LNISSLSYLIHSLIPSRSLLRSLFLSKEFLDANILKWKNHICTA
jgi:hypothetical protein